MDEFSKLRNELLEKYELPVSHKSYKAFGIAWDLGHASGLSEVETYFKDLVDLIK